MALMGNQTKKSEAIIPTVACIDTTEAASTRAFPLGSVDAPKREACCLALTGLLLVLFRVDAAVQLNSFVSGDIVFLPFRGGRSVHTASSFKLSNQRLTKSSRGNALKPSRRRVTVFPFRRGSSVHSFFFQAVALTMSPRGNAVKPCRQWSGKRRLVSARTYGRLFEEHAIKLPATIHACDRKRTSGIREPITWSPHISVMLHAPHISTLGTSWAETRREFVTLNRRRSDRWRTDVGLRVLGVHVASREAGRPHMLGRRARRAREQE